LFASPVEGSIASHKVLYDDTFSYAQTLYATQNPGYGLLTLAYYLFINNTVPIYSSHVSLYIYSKTAGSEGSWIADSFYVSFVLCNWSSSLGSWRPVIPGAGYQGDESLVSTSLLYASLTYTGWYNFTLANTIPETIPYVSTVALAICPEIDFNGKSHLKIGNAAIGSSYSSMYYNDTSLIKSSGSPMFRIFGNVINMTTNDVTDLSTDTAVIHGAVTDDVHVAMECGFWVGNVSTNATNFEQNISVGIYEAPDTFQYTLTGLTPGKYYYVRTWSMLLGSIYISSTEKYLLTKPQPPTGLATSSVGPTWLNISWTKATVDVANQTTLLRYSTTNYPSTVTDGTLLYNGTGSYFNHTGLSGGKNYFYSLWTYINGSGSPFYWWYSGSTPFLTNTSGSTYNVSIRWECDGTYVNLSDATLDNDFSAYDIDGNLVYHSFPTATDGNFSFTPTWTVAVVRFRINDTGTRSMVLDPAQRHVTIYAPCGSVGTDWGDLQLVTIFFRDFTGSLNKENHAYAYLYTFYPNGTKKFIHMDVIQADSALRTPLPIGGTYYVGVVCDSFIVDPLGPLTIIEEQFEIDVVHPPDYATVWYQLFNITYGWTVGHLAYVDFFDHTHFGTTGASWVNVTITDRSTGIEQYTSEPVTPWDFYASTPVTNYTHDQTIVLIVMYNSSTENWITSITFVLKGQITTTPMTSDENINDMLNNTIGESPVFITNSDGTTTIISWSAVILAFFVTAAMFVFSREFAGLGPVMAGIIIAFFNVKLGITAGTTIFLAGALVMIGILVLFIEQRRR
jgi:hypothetical protein